MTNPDTTLFRWGTLKEIGQQPLQHQGRLIPGKIWEVALASGRTIRAWRSDDCQQYFCHGLTFGGKDAPGGPISPFTGLPVEIILQGHYEWIPEVEALPGDILVWQGLAPETTPHSAVLTGAFLVSGKNYLDDTTTRLQTKNGLLPEANMSLEQVLRIYGESYRVYRRR